MQAAFWPSARFLCLPDPFLGVTYQTAVIPTDAQPHGKLSKVPVGYSEHSGAAAPGFNQWRSQDFFKESEAKVFWIT